MLGSSASISDCNVVLNTAVAEVLKGFADELENASDFSSALHNLIKRTCANHKRIIFNGNGYDDKWIEEAQKRGLLNLCATPDAMPYFLKQKNIDLFTSHKVYTEKEMYSRYDILLGSYCSLIAIEARTMVDMALKDILPAISEYSQTLCSTLLSKREVCKQIDATYEKEMLTQISALEKVAYESVKDLQTVLANTENIADITARARAFKDDVLTIMQSLREAVDALENIVSADYWPFPTYGELLFGINE